MEAWSFYWKVPVLLATLLCLARSVSAQTATIEGRVFDQSGAVVPGAGLTLSQQNRLIEQSAAGKDGAFSFRGIPVGSYTLVATAPRLEQSQPLELRLGPGLRVVRIELVVAAVRQEATVQDT